MMAHQVGGGNGSLKNLETQKKEAIVINIKERKKFKRKPYKRKSFYKKAK